MKIVIVNTVLSNAGDAAIFESAISLLNKIYDRVEITAYDSNVEWSAKAYPQYKIKSDQEIIGEDFGIYDLVLLTGGTYLVAPYILDERLSTLRHVLKTAQCPIILLPMTIGPFIESAKWCYVLNQVDAIFIRERASIDYLISIGVEKNRLYFTPDIVWSNRVDSYTLNHSDKPSISGKVLINVRLWYDETERFVSEIVEYCVLLLAVGKEIHFVSTCQGVSNYHDDSRLAQLIVDALPAEYQNKIKVLSDHYSPSDIYGLIGNYELVVSTRMHLAILALQKGVPTITIKYQPKFKQRLNELGLKELSSTYTDVTADELWFKTQIWQQHRDYILPRVKSVIREQNKFNNLKRALAINKMMLVLLDFPKQSETFVANEIRELLCLGWQIELIVGRAEAGVSVPDNLLSYPNLTVRYLTGGEPLSDLKLSPEAKERLIWPADLLASLDSHLRAFNGQIIYCHFGYTGTIVQHLLLRAGSDKILISKLHGADMSRFIYKKVDHLYEQFFTRCDLLVPTTERWANRLTELGVESRRILVNRVGINLARFVFNMNNTEPKSKNQPITILSVARLVDKKGLDDGIKVMAELKKIWPQVKYQIIGGGPKEEALKELIREYSLDEVVELKGQMAHNDVIGFMRQADVLLVPSKTAPDGDEEGLPIVSMEAMALGLPVVATKHSGLVELVINKRTGLTTDEGDITGLVSALDFMLKMSRPKKELLLRMARKKVEKLSDSQQNAVQFSSALKQFALKSLRRNHP